MYKERNKEPGFDLITSMKMTLGIFLDFDLRKNKTS